MCPQPNDTSLHAAAINWIHAHSLEQAAKKASNFLCRVSSPAGIETQQRFPLRTLLSRPALPS
jgi:hypothetical protein